MSIENEIASLTTAVRNLTEVLLAASSIARLPAPSAVAVEAPKAKTPKAPVPSPEPEAKPAPTPEAKPEPTPEAKPAPTPEPEAKPEQSITPDRLRAVAIELMQNPAIGAVKVSAAVKGCGVESIKLAPEAKYAQILIALEALRG